MLPGTCVPTTFPPRDGEWTRRGERAKKSPTLSHHPNFLSVNLLSRSLYGILDFGYIAPAEAASFAGRMIEGGVGILQIRAKGLSERVAVEAALAVRKVIAGSGVPLILNDYPHLVDEAGADGVHVGQDDLPVAEARAASSRPILVGQSTHSLAQAEAAVAEQPDYIGFGPLFATPTKPDYTPIGMEDIRAAHRRVDLPIFCIGGVKLENLPAVLAAGARRVVIVSGILQAPDVVAYCRSASNQLSTIN